jgi:hypothetical protein
MSRSREAALAPARCLRHCVCMSRQQEVLARQIALLEAGGDPEDLEGFAQPMATAGSSVRGEQRDGQQWMPSHVSADRREHGSWTGVGRDRHELGGDRDGVHDVRTASRHLSGGYGEQSNGRDWTAGSLDQNRSHAQFVGSSSGYGGSTAYGGHDSSRAGDYGGEYGATNTYDASRTEAGYGAHFQQENGFGYGVGAGGYSGDGGGYNSGAVAPLEALDAGK